MRPIILFGYMCAGKTTVGKTLAKFLNRSFYDLDWYIEERFHKRIPEIFEERGEEGFRDIERRMLRELGTFEDIILSCGGGTPCFFDNAQYANDCGLTVYLKASPDTIIQHLRLSHTDRPLLRNKQGDELRHFIQEQLAQREPYYTQAQITLNVDVLDDFAKIDDVANHLANIIREIEQHGKMEN